MTQKKYTAGEKSEALRLLEEEGIWSAVAGTGASHTSIYRWWSSHERSLKKTPEEIAIEEDEERILGVRLRRRMMLTAMAHVDRSDASESALEGLRWMTAAGIAFDKLNKVGGTSSSVVLTEAFLDSEIARLEEELGRVAPNNQRANLRMDQSSIDQSLGRAMEEWERKIRAEVTEELTGVDQLGRPVRTPELIISKPQSATEQWNEAADQLNNPNGHQPPTEGD